MAKKPQLDVRKLKDEVAEYLKKQKWEKAADVLEQLAAAESKDMTHRLRLGDAYRRLEQVEKAITNYQHAAKVFSDEGQLIKAIGAVKIILEIDPRNAEAQKQLVEMNDRRFNNVTLERAARGATRARFPPGCRRPRPPGGGRGWGRPHRRGRRPSCRRGSRTTRSRSIPASRKNRRCCPTTPSSSRRRRTSPTTATSR